MASGIAAAGLVLLVVGVLGVAVGLALIVLTQEDQPTQDEGFVADPGRSADDGRQGRTGQTVAVGGGAVAFLGLVFVVIGRAD